MNFIPKFADLARNAATVTGTDPVQLGSALPGFANIATALAEGDRFYYNLSNLEQPDEREIGRGTLQAGGVVAREAVEGPLTTFSAETKAIALVTAAEWYDKLEAGPAIASAAQIRAGDDASAMVAPAPIFAAAAPVELAESDSIAPDFDSGINFNLTLAGDALLDSPVNAKPGQSGRIRIAQDGAGGHSLQFGPLWQFLGASPAVTSGAGAVDILSYFVNNDGSIEAAFVNDLRTRPIPLSTSDFKNGIYTLGGESRTFEEMWESHPDGTFQPGSVVPGVGWQTVASTTVPNDLMATAGHLSGLLPLSDGFTVVLEYFLDQPSGTKPRINVWIDEYPNYATGWAYFQNGKDDIAAYDYASGNTADWAVIAPGPVGDVIAATTLSPDQIAISHSGGAAVIATIDPQDNLPANEFGLSVYTSHNGTIDATATLKKVSIYRAVDAALLPSMSS